MPNSLIVQLPIPVNYPQEELNSKIVTVLQTLVAGLAMVIVAEELQWIEVVRSILVGAATSVTLIVYVLGMVGRDVLRNQGLSVLKKVFVNPIAIFLVILGACIFFKVPYYSILYLIPSIVLTLLLLLNFTKGLTFTEMLTSVAFICMNIFFALSLLRQQNFIDLDEQIIFILPILSLLGFQLEVIHDVLEQKNKRSYNFNYSTYKIFIFNKIMMTEFIVNSLGFALKKYISGGLYVTIISAFVGIDIVVAIVLVAFRRELTLFITCPQFTQWEALFRIGQRDFIEIYNPRLCHRDQVWGNQSCGLCEKQATVVDFPCGHLSTCKTCSDSLSRKDFMYCLLCGERVTRKKQLKLDAHRFRYGYKGKFFIQKKLLKNQFLVYG